MNKKMIKALSISVILTVGILGTVSGFDKTDDTKTSKETKVCAHKDADACANHTSESCEHKDGTTTENHSAGKCDHTASVEKSASCKSGKAKTCNHKSGKKEAKPTEDSGKTI